VTVPVTNLNADVVSGATSVTYFRFARMTRSAIRTRIDAARRLHHRRRHDHREMINITSIGGDVGATPNATR